MRVDLLPSQLNICYDLFIDLPTKFFLVKWNPIRSLSPQKWSANILRTSFQRIVITKMNVVPTQLFLYLICLFKPISKSILQYIIKWELEKFQQYRNRNPDHLHGKNRICMENKKMKNLKTSCNLYLNCPLNEVHENAKNIGFVSYLVFSAQR